jgi:hypothetical protein
MAGWIKDETSEGIEEKPRLQAMRARRESSILDTYRQANDISLDEALRDALDLGIQQMAQSGARTGVNRTTVLAVAFALLASSFGGYAFAKSKAPELLTKEWAKNIEMRLTRAEDDIQENASHLDEMEY